MLQFIDVRNGSLPAATLSAERMTGNEAISAWLFVTSDRGRKLTRQEPAERWNWRVWREVTLNCIDLNHTAEVYIA